MAKKPQTTIPGVIRRAGTPNYQLQLEIPSDLADKFTQKKWIRMSLGTSDVASANAKAIPLIAEFRAKVDALRMEAGADTREGSYASAVMHLASDTGVFRPKATPKATGAFTCESAVLSVRAGQKTVDDLRAELSEATRNVTVWAQMAQALREALTMLDRQGSDESESGIVTVSQLKALRCENMTQREGEGYVYATKILLSTVGEVDIRSIDKAMARGVRDYVAGMGIADGTKKRYYSLIIALFNWGVSEGLLDACIFDGVKLVTEGKKVLDRSNMTFETFGQIVSGFCVKSDYQKFIPILQFVTGARPEEICQLGMSDVKISSSGIPFLRIANSEDTQVKNKNSVRDVPIATFVWETLKFKEYVENRRKKNAEKLFDLGKYAGSYNRWFSQERYSPWKSTLGWGQEMGLHSIRHLFTFAVANYAKACDAELREMMVGHAPTTSSVAGVYLKGYTLDRARDALDSVDWAGLVDFSPLLAD